MSAQVFPTVTQLPGTDISISRKVEWDTIVQEAVSGKETRVARRIYPRREYGLKFNFLRSSTVFVELQTLEGFFNSREGMFDSFLWTDPDDNHVNVQPIGVGNGVAQSFQLVRSIQGAVEPIYAPQTVTNVYLGSTATLAGGFTWSSWNGSTAPGFLTLSTGALPMGTNLYADFSYYWPVRFTLDDMTFERFVSLIYENKKITFKNII